MIKELSEYKNTLNDFVNYLKKQNIDIKSFFILPFKYRIGFYIEFLSIKNIIILYDSFNYIVYYDKECINAIETIKLKNSFIINESNNSNITNVLFPIENFKLGLIEAFKHLEIPF